MGGPNNPSLRKATATTRQSGNTATKPDYWVLLYVPNLIGYVRLSLLLLAFCLLHYSAAWFVSLYTASIVLDGFDGFAARRLHQCSLFGAWFDVVLDNLSRGLLWTHIHPLLYLVSALEWMTFCCNYVLGAEWQQTFTQGKKKGFRYLVACLMGQNWRNPVGVWVVLGLHVFPLWLFGIQHGIFTSHLTFVSTSMQTAARVKQDLNPISCWPLEGGQLEPDCKLIISSKNMIKIAQEISWHHLDCCGHLRYSCKGKYLWSSSGGDFFHGFYFLWRRNLFPGENTTALQDRC